jgi:ribosomal protein L11 methyltransferase
MQIAPRVILTRASGREVPGFLCLPELPSAAFGDGSHPTTRLCASAVDAWCRMKPPKRVLDVGTGTGVLARIARARGAEVVVGTDIDDASLEAARRNAALDDHSVEIAFSSKPPDAWGPAFDLVIANILEGVLLSLAPALKAALAPGGTLLLSGFTPAQVPALKRVFGEATESTLEGWSLLFLTQK